MQAALNHTPRRGEQGADRPGERQPTDGDGGLDDVTYAVLVAEPHGHAAAGQVDAALVEGDFAEYADVAGGAEEAVAEDFGVVATSIDH